ncbi:MAG: AraC family transcriptional regulator [Spirochaetaceae bacterium]
MNTEPMIGLYEELEHPRDYFQGDNFPINRLPEEVLLFFRGSSKEIMKYGDIAQHHRIVLCICLDISGSVQIDAEIFDLHPMECCLIFPFQPHHFTGFKDTKVAWLFISFELNKYQWLETLRNTVFSITKEEVDLLNKMAIYSHSNRKQILPIQLVLLLEQLLSSDAIKRKDTVLQNHEQNSNQLINLPKVLRYIHQNLDSIIQVSDVLKIAGCSEPVLRDLFKTYFGSAIATYIRKIRILRASHLLVTSDKLISEISEQCGFSSQYAFSRTFKQIIGLAPKEYRYKFQTVNIYKNYQLGLSPRKSRQYHD